MSLPARTTDTDLLDSLRDLIGPALRNELWLFFTDARDEPIPLAIPVEDVPMRLPAVERLGEVVVETGRMAGAAAVLLVWERPGDAWLSDEEAEFVDAVEAAIAPDLRVRAQALSSDSGVRLLASAPA
ncbi:hypothetical protein QDR37_14905 [Amnibacterium sp. CER49]|uniref:hypothetical protein n=1 Tax=Amnibacterium sp. CER49 TaxID=3039161 RepID=UPI00244C6A94|nr:hypothetical protein [Amnibacterium sp. CER49]MDH2445240.1 hypothetical protein [Amnibacterium sp. CER49]